MQGNPKLLGRSTLQWPHQPKPGKKSWQAWARCLRKTYLPKGRSMALCTPLGQWLQPVDTQDIDWSYLYDSEKASLWKKRTTTWTRHEPIRSVRNRNSGFFSRHPIEILSSLPLGCTPATADTRPGGYFAMFCPDLVINPPIPQPQTFQEYLEQTPLWCRPLLVTNQARKTIDELRSALQAGTPMYLVSDGAADDGVGAFGWVLASPTIVYWEGAGPVFGEAVHSFRAESYGALAGLQFLLRFLQYHQLVAYTNFLLYFCGNEGLIKRLNFSRGTAQLYPGYYLKPEFDLEKAILDMLS